jgi:5,6,7,8-tetrahydromethanopterin hydro-lyase
MVSKVTVKSGKYTNTLMGTVQAAIANGVLDAVRAGDIPKDKVNDLGIIYSVWLDPSVTEVDDLDHKALFDVHREATGQGHQKGDAPRTVDRLASGKPGQCHALFS